MRSSAHPAPRCSTTASTAEREEATVPQFLVTAHDGSDAEAPARRAAARPAHLDGIAALGGAMIVGGAMLDSAGTPIGSTMVMEFADRAALDAVLAKAPSGYLVGGKLTIADLSFVTWNKFAFIYIVNEMESVDVERDYPAFYA